MGNHLFEPTLNYSRFIKKKTNIVQFIESQNILGNGLMKIAMTDLMGRKQKNVRTAL